MAEKELIVEENKDVATLILNRPYAMNAINFNVLHALHDRVEAYRFRPDVRVIIITGAGEKAFSAGADLKERVQLTPEKVKEFIIFSRDLFTSIEKSGKAVIAAINGFALGSGTELALACDIRIASTEATMGLTETRLAIIPGAGGTQRLPRLVGKGKAKELIFTGRMIKADEAKEIGLVNRVCPYNNLMNECLGMAEMILEAGPIAIEQAKYAIDSGIDTDITTGLAIESNAYWVCIPTEDRMEGLAAFKEKRKPLYKGK
jgi:enoyl-CoA hydratase/carnithine racemase